MPKIDSDSGIIRKVGRNILKALVPTVIPGGASVGLDRTDIKKTSAGDSSARRSSHAASIQDSVFRGGETTSRLARYADYREMDNEVPELSQSLAVVVAFTFSTESDATGLELKFSEDARSEVQEVAKGTYRRLDFDTMGPAVQEEGGRLGDSFSELIYNKDMDIVAEKALTPDTVDVVHDAYGRLTGYRVTGQGVGGLPGRALMLQPYEVAHYAPDARRNHKYGRSYWASARKLWSAESGTLDVLSILTILRAASRKSVAYPVPQGTDAEGIQEWVDNLRQGNWTEDIFNSEGSMRRRISSLLEMDDNIYPYRQGTGDKPVFHNETSADLRQVVEVLQYYQERYFVVTGVPAGLAGLERNVNARGTLEQQAKNFVRMIRKRQEEMRRFLERIIYIALMAKGITIRPGEFTIVFPDIATFDQKTVAETNDLNARTVTMLTAQGYDRIFTAQQYMGLDKATAEKYVGELPVEGPPAQVDPPQVDDGA